MKDPTLMKSLMGAKSVRNVSGHQLICIDMKDVILEKNHTNAKPVIKVLAQEEV